MTAAYFLGDSLVAIALADALCARMDWTYVARAPQNAPPGGTIDGTGGSGYVNPSTWEPFGGATRLDYLLAAVPDAVLVIGGGNDSAYTDAQVETAATAFWVAVRAGLPNATLYGTFLHRPPAAAKAAAIQAAAAAARATWIDASGWVTGTGYVGAEAGDGNADVYVSADGVHPSAAGNAYLGVRLAHAIRPPATGLDF